MGPNYKKTDFLEPWFYIDSDGRLEKELHIEIGSGHKLYNQNVIAIARRFDCDDVLFCYGEYFPILAVVHLTWSAKQETNPLWPTTEIFQSWDEWVQMRMVPDNQGYQD